MNTYFTILGTGAGPGLPSFFCDCAACREARQQPELARTRSGAYINAAGTHVLIDTSPDLRRQLVKENITQVDLVFLTHWHYDHFGGIGELEYYVKLARREPIPLFLPPSAVTEFTAAFPDLADVFTVNSWEFARTYRCGDVSLTPLPAEHGIETAGFLLAAGHTRIAYFPDTAGLPAATAACVQGVDWLVCDATFHGDNWYPHAHMSQDEAIALGKNIQAGKTVLTHMAVHYSTPVTACQLAAEVAGHANVLAAYDGMRLELK